MDVARNAFVWLGNSGDFGLKLMRVAIAIVFIWIGAVKFAPYEADSITPFVANNPVLSLFYKHPDQYKAHLTREGELIAEQRAWQEDNGTYVFSRGLGSVELTIGCLVLLGLASTTLGAIGAVLAFFTSLVTLSFLFTTPEAWVPPLGDAQHGFPFLSGAGRLVLKDVMLLAGGWLIMADSARRLYVRYEGSYRLPLSPRRGVLGPTRRVRAFRRVKT
jgi:uncharacterized membrane protein YkgB